MDLHNLSRSQLIAVIERYRRGEGEDANNEPMQSDAADKQNSVKKPRNFDYSRFARRKIAMRIAYLGWNHDGFASQQDTDNTVESHLFKALSTLKLVEDLPAADYARCGRTDKGVSAIGQVVSLVVRSKHPAGADLLSSATQHFDHHQGEFDYARMLNRILPHSIRILGWQPVAEAFDARFDCTYRQYKYYFPRQRLDLEAMQRAAQYLVGTHDFRNFCKIDASKGERQTFERTILYAGVQVETEDHDAPDELSICSFNIRGTAFIWHQVRCTMTLLLLIGRGLEQPELVRELLNIEKYPVKPDYQPACGIPLVLWDCGYNNDRQQFNAPFQTDSMETHGAIISTLRELWKPLACKQFLLRSLFTQVMDSMPVTDKNCRVAEWSGVKHEWLRNNSQLEREKHRPLLQRRTGASETVEQRLQRFQQKLDRKRRLAAEAAGVDYGMR